MSLVVTDIKNARRLALTMAQTNVQTSQICIMNASSVQLLSVKDHTTVSAADGAYSGVSVRLEPNLDREARQPRNPTSWLGKSAHLWCRQ